jgi:hypothetical protein
MSRERGARHERVFFGEGGDDALDVANWMGAWNLEIDFSEISFRKAEFLL